MQDNQRRFEEDIDQRLNFHDYHHIFMRGCCFHFALKLNELYDLKLRYILSDAGGVAHCWAKKEGGRAVDINGVLEEKIIVSIFDYDNRKKVGDISRQGLETELKKKKISEALDMRIFQLAEKIIKTHRRFEDAKPFDPFTAEDIGLA